MGLLRQNHDTPISIPSKCFEHGFWEGILACIAVVPLCQTKQCPTHADTIPSISCLLRAVSKRRQRNKLGKLKGNERNLAGHPVLPQVFNHGPSGLPHSHSSLPLFATWQLQILKQSKHPNHPRHPQTWWATPMQRHTWFCKLSLYMRSCTITSLQAICSFQIV